MHEDPYGIGEPFGGRRSGNRWLGCHRRRILVAIDGRWNLSSWPWLLARARRASDPTASTSLEAQLDLALIEPLP